MRTLYSVHKLIKVSDFENLRDQRRLGWLQDSERGFSRYSVDYPRIHGVRAIHGIRGARKTREVNGAHEIHGIRESDSNLLR